MTSRDPFRRASPPALRCGRRGSRPFPARPHAERRRPVLHEGAGGAVFPRGRVLSLLLHLRDEREHGLRAAVHDDTRKPPRGAQQHTGAALGAAALPAVSPLRCRLVRRRASWGGRGQRDPSAARAGAGALDVDMGTSPLLPLRYPERPRVSVLHPHRGHSPPGVVLPRPADALPVGRVRGEGDLLRDSRRRDPDHALQLLAGDVQPADAPVRDGGHRAGVRPLHGAVPPGLPPRGEPRLPRLSRRMDCLRLAARDGVSRVPVGNARGVAVLRDSRSSRLPPSRACGA